MNAVNTSLFLLISALVMITFVLVFPAHVTFHKHIVYLLKAGAIVSCMFTVCVCVARWVGGGGESPAVFP